MIIKKRSILKTAWFIYFIVLLNFYDIPGIQMFSMLSIIALTLFCIPYKLYKRNFFASKWYLIFFIYISLSFIWAVYKDTSSGVYEAVLRTLLFSLCLDAFCDSKENTDYMLNVICFSGVFYAIHVLLTTPISAYGTLDVGLSVNAQRNFVGQVCALVSIICIVRFLNEKIRIRRYMFIVAALICYIVACISGSRKAFLMVPLAIMLYIVTLDSTNKKIRYFLLVIVVAIVFLSVFASSPYLQEYFGERLLAFFDESIEDKSIDGRNYLSSVAISLFHQHPILGMGCDNVRSYLISIEYQNQVYAHNNYLELLADYGIIGFILFYSFHIRALFRTIRNKWNNVYLKLIFIFILVMMFMDYGQVSYQRHMYIYMIVVVCSSLKWDSDRR